MAVLVAAVVVLDVGVLSALSTSSGPTLQAQTKDTHYLIVKHILFWFSWKNKFLNMQ